MALVEPYCTRDEAKEYLKGSETWASASSAQRDNALFWGRVYLDSNYSCIYFDPDNPPDEIKYANALLAEDYLQGTLIETGQTSSGKIKKKRSVAGSVESEVEYTDQGLSQGNPQDDVDRLLADYCTSKKSSGVMNLTRN